MSKTETAPEKKRSYHVIRGGSWGSVPRTAGGRRLAWRLSGVPGYRSGNLGVRLVEVIDEQD